MDELNQKINQALRALQQKIGKSRERAWILREISDESWRKDCEKLSVVGLHMLSLLCQQAMTGIELADRLLVTRGGVTQAAKTLLKTGMIESFQQDDNRKKIFYQPTDKGRAIGEIHDRMHQQMDRVFEKELFANYSAAEKAIVLRFLSEAVQVNDRFEQALDKVVKFDKG